MILSCVAVDGALFAQVKALLHEILAGCRMHVESSWIVQLLLCCFLGQWQSREHSCPHWSTWRHGSLQNPSLSAAADVALVVTFLCTGQQKSIDNPGVSLSAGNCRFSNVEPQCFGTPLLSKYPVFPSTYIPSLARLRRTIMRLTSLTGAQANQ